MTEYIQKNKRKHENCFFNIIEMKHAFKVLIEKIKQSI